MSFTTRNGTYGARQPKGGALTRWFNDRMVKRVRRKGGKLMGMPALALGTIGKKTGERRYTPVAMFPGIPESTGWIVVASAAGGARNPAWYYNIAAHPDDVTVEFAGKVTEVTPVELHGDERAEAWAKILTIAPRFARYETVTDRVIPIIRLLPKDPG
jgi:deazaflavin-dependent oxidoreductase (nitroreductase family)